ncbi:MAG: OadG family protein [Clostridia bacterium]|nr:OadG family protein [Clostridia bacterium]
MIYSLLDIIADPDNPGNFIFSSKSESLIYALIGFAVVFAGICILILVIWLIGLLMKRTNNLAALTKSGRAARREQTVREGVVIETVSPPAAAVPSGVISEAVIERCSPPDEIPDEVKAAIVAAITAYYMGSDSSCEFVVKRIKRL